MTTRRESRPKALDDSLNKLQRASTWAGLQRGDRVEITDTRLRSATWEFVAHVRNVASGEEWIEVVGGKGRDRHLRSFRPERVFAPARKGKKAGQRSSLADAPRLPFD
jgi:hypothetical protein